MPASASLEKTGEGDGSCEAAADVCLMQLSHFQHPHSACIAQSALAGLQQAVHGEGVMSGKWDGRGQLLWAGRGPRTMVPQKRRLWRCSPIRLR